MRRRARGTRVRKSVNDGTAHAATRAGCARCPRAAPYPAQPHPLEPPCETCNTPMLLEQSHAARAVPCCSSRQRRDTAAAVSCAPR